MQLVLLIQVVIRGRSLCIWNLNDLPSDKFCLVVERERERVGKMCDFGHTRHLKCLISAAAAATKTLQLGLIFHCFYLPFFDSTTFLSLSLSLWHRTVRRPNYYEAQMLLPLLLMMMKRFFPSTGFSSFGFVLNSQLNSSQLNCCANMWCRRT